jgi:hypothetical protein
MARHPSPAGGQIIHGDALYYNEQAVQGETDPVRLAKFLVSLAAYRQHDLLVQTLWEHHALQGIDDKERKSLVSELIPSRSLAWRCLGALAGRIDNRKLREWTATLRLPRAEDWHDADFY